MKAGALLLALTLLTVIGTGWYVHRAGIEEGERRCPPCERLQTLTELKRVLSKTLYLVTMQDGRLVEMPFTVPPKGALREYLAIIHERFSGRLGSADAAINFRFFVSYSYGFDLSQPFDLRQEGERLVFQAPPLRLLTCPSINLGTLQAQVERSSYLVPEEAEKQAIAGKLTEQAVRLGEAALLGTDTRAEIRRGAEDQLKTLLSSLAAAYGMTVRPDQIQVAYAKEYDAAPWREDDPEAIRQRLGKYHCIQ